jgi:hypothetical protein
VLPSAIRASLNTTGSISSIRSRPAAPTASTGECTPSRHARGADRGRADRRRFAMTSNSTPRGTQGGEPSRVDQRKADGLIRSRFGRKRSRTSASMSCSPSSVRITASRRRTVCTCDMSVKELIETKERVDAALGEILGGGSVKKERNVNRRGVPTPIGEPSY